MDGRTEAAAASGREDAAYQAGFESMRYDAAVWYDALEKAVPAVLAAADGWDREHGWVRIDTADPTLAHRIALRTHAVACLFGESCERLPRYEAEVTALLIALAAVGAPQGEAS